MGSGGVKLVAVLMIATALGLALYAWTMSRRGPEKPQPVVVEAPSPGVRAVTALHDLAAGETVADGAVALTPVEAVPGNGFTGLEQVLGRRLIRSVASGRPLTRMDFTFSSLAQALRPGEMGVAIQVTPVIGVGGFLRPGDLVDLLLYLKKKKPAVTSSRAQVLASRLRLLCYGESCARFTHESPVLEIGGHESTGLSPDSKARTAVLAVPEPQLTRLMLGANAGTLRLALRSALEASPAEPSAETARDQPSAREPFRFAPRVTLVDLTGDRPPPPAPPRARRRAAATVVEVVRGSNVERISR